MTESGSGSIANTTFADVERMSEQMTPQLRAMPALDVAAQWFVRELRERFPSIVLARVFGTVPADRLPPAERAAADAAAGVALFPRTDVLTLFGTAGTQPAWNERHRSEGHRAIPLVSRAHVENIPMVSRLLSDLRYRHPGDPAPAPFVMRAVANANGLFFLPDAATALDERGRKVIPAGDFVREHSIRSVFGFGGSYVIQPTFISTIVFTQESITKETAMHFLQLSSALKAGTARLVNRGLLFGREDAARGNG